MNHQCIFVVTLYKRLFQKCCASIWLASVQKKILLFGVQTYRLAMNVSKQNMKENELNASVVQCTYTRHRRDFIYQQKLELSIDCKVVKWINAHTFNDVDPIRQIYIWKTAYGSLSLSLSYRSRYIITSHQGINISTQQLSCFIHSIQLLSRVYQRSVQCSDFEISVTNFVFLNLTKLMWKRATSSKPGEKLQFIS